MNLYPELPDDENMVHAADYPIPNDQGVYWSSSESDLSESESNKLKYYEVNELSQNQTRYHSGVETTEHQAQEDKQPTRIAIYHRIPMWKLKIFTLATILLFIVAVVTLLAAYISDNKTVAPALDPTPVSLGKTLKVLDTITTVGKALGSVIKRL